MSNGDLKIVIYNYIKSILTPKDYVLSATVVGSFVTSKGLEGISDIDVVIIVDDLDSIKFNGIIDEFKEFNLSDIGLNDFSLRVNSTFGPLKFDKERLIVFHVMIYDVKGHIEHVEKSPFTCFSWEDFKPIFGKSLSEIYPTLNIQLSDLIEARRGLLNYINDIRNSSLSYKEYSFDEKGYTSVSKKFSLDQKHRIEYSYHIFKNLLFNTYRIFCIDAKVFELQKLKSFFLSFDINFSDYLEYFTALYDWKKNNALPPIDVQKKTEEFLQFFYNFLDKINSKLHRIDIYRHEKTHLNDGTFLGIGRNPSILIINERELNEVNYNFAYHSELNRAEQTIKLFSYQKAIESKLLNEIDYGKAEGMSLKSLSENYPEIIKMWEQRGDPSFPGGESQNDVLERVRSFFKNELNLDSDILIVTHLVVIRMILKIFSNIDVWRIYRVQIQHMESLNFTHFHNFILTNFPKNQRKNLREQLSDVKN